MDGRIAEDVHRMLKDGPQTNCYVSKSVMGRHAARDLCDRLRLRGFEWRDRWEFSRASDDEVPGLKEDKKAAEWEAMKPIFSKAIAKLLR